MKEKTTIHIRGVDRELLMRVKIQSVLTAKTQGEIINSILEDYFGKNSEAFGTGNIFIKQEEE